MNLKFFLHGLLSKELTRNFIGVILALHIMPTLIIL